MMVESQKSYQISPSQISAHKECSQRWYFNYGMNLKPLGETESFFLVGSYFHELSHFLYNLVQSGMEIGSPALKQAMIQKMKRDLETVDRAFGPVVVQTHLMFHRYLERRVEELDRNIEVLEVEKELRIEVEPGLDLMGILDLAYIKRGQLYLRDHKTGEKSNSHSQEKMEFQDQLLFYATLWYKLYGDVPHIEVSWISSKIYAKGDPIENDKLFRNFIRPVSKNELEGYWNYILNYVKFMRSHEPVMRFNTQCSTCRFREACIMSMKGQDNSKVLANNFRVVKRDYEFTKFTELSQQSPLTNITLKESGITLRG